MRVHFTQRFCEQRRFSTKRLHNNCGRADKKSELARVRWIESESEAFQRAILSGWRRNAPAGPSLCSKAKLLHFDANFLPPSHNWTSLDRRASRWMKSVASSWNELAAEKSTIKIQMIKVDLMLLFCERVLSKRSDRTENVQKATLLA